jgi:D-alanyl-D-alanine carboxypeptidase/D-alanyl-D-alanine-endopeptidase (penicillin-binding protein 4)
VHLRLQQWLGNCGLQAVSYHVRGTSGSTLAAHADSTARRGASTTKLVTIDAALRVLGPHHRFSLEVLSDGQRLYLRGCHPWVQVPELLELAASVQSSAPTLLLDDTRYPRFVLPDGWSADDLPLNVQPVMPMNLREYFGLDPAAAVAEAVAGILTAFGHPTRYAGRAVAQGAVDGQVLSPPLLDLAVECLQTSHNLMAEVIGRETAIALGLNPDFESMQAALTTGLNADLAGVSLHDASGLSLDDRVRADLLTHILQTWLGPLMFARAALPLAGLTGTMSAINDWFQSGPAAHVRGFVQAKSGTHVNCVALAGYTFVPDRPVRIFAILVDDLPGPSPHLQVRREVEEFVRLVATH